jgi:hypothetical protein
MWWGVTERHLTTACSRRRFAPPRMLIVQSDHIRHTLHRDGGLMNYAEMILPEFDRDIANTRKVLERVPEDRLDWQDHAKSAGTLPLITMEK